MGAQPPPIERTGTGRFAPGPPLIGIAFAVLKNIFIS